MKKLGNILLILLLILPVFNFPDEQKANADTSYQFEVLELVDKLSAGKLESNNKIKVTQMTMKQFVAQRSEIDGVYDAIYFGEGAYNPALPNLNPNPNNGNKLNIDNSNNIRTKAHNTSNIMNDITQLKANEIINAYINKGLLVVFHNSIADQSCENNKLDNRKCILKESLYTKYKSDYPNVRTVSNADSFEGLLFENSRPRFQLTNAPAKLTEGAYQENDTITYRFNLLKGTKENLTANLYFDLNFDNQYSPEEIIKSSKLTDLPETSSNEFEFNYKLLKGYTGPRYWKFEVVNNVGLKQIQTDVFKFNGEKLELSVLQVLPNSGTGNLTNVLKDQVIEGKHNNVINTDEYKITIDTVKLNDFNSSGYKSLNNGKYNMLIFGFEDSYAQNQNITVDAAQEVRRYAETGQSLFLNHDTFIRKNTSQSGSIVTLNPTTNWIESLFDLSGQTYEIKNLNGTNVGMETKLKNPGSYFAEHNFGWGALAQTSKSKKVNDGIITNYPYNLDSEVDIATTHSQYFTLNLEDPNVVPWYNLKSDSRDNYDSWNHYYIYSRNNITYSGAGHSSNNFQPEEQQLFVNTMYRAFIGANHQPNIIVNSPNTETSIPSYQKDVVINYKVEDLDLPDRFLNTKVIVNNSTILNKTNVPNGSVISTSVEHGLIQGGTLPIRIEVSDQKGAKKIESFEITVDKVEANLELSRTVQNENESAIYKVEEPVVVQYTVTPKDVSINSGSVDGSKFKPLAMLESAANQLTLGQKTTIYSKEEFDKSTGSIRAIYFNEDNSAPNLKENVISGYGENLSISVLNQQRNSSQLFHIINGNKTGKLVEGLESIAGKNEEILVAVADSLPEGGKPNYIKFACFNNLRTNGANGNGNFELYGDFCGFYGEGFNQNRVLSFKETFPKGISIDKKDVNNLENVKVSTSADGKTTVEGSLRINYSQASNLYKGNSASFSIKITPENKGDYELKNSVLTDEATEDHFEFNPLYISARNGLDSINIPTEIYLSLNGEPVNVNVNYNPNDALTDGIIKEIKWTSDNSNIAAVNNQGTISPQGIGETQVTVEVKDIFGTTKHAEVKVIVFNPILELKAASELTLYVGEEKSIDLNLKPESAKPDVRWEIGNNHLIEVNKNTGMVKGLVPGDTFVKVSGIGANGELISATTKVVVKQKVSSISVYPSPLTLKVGETYNLNDFTVTISPHNATNKEFEWVRESNAHIEFTGDVFSASKPGQTSIIVRSRDGFAQQEVKVIVVSPLEGIYFNPNRIQVEKGDTLNINGLIKKNPENTTENIVSKDFSIDNNALARINKDGIFHAKRLGEVSVTVMARSESNKPLQATLTIEIVEKGSSSKSDNGDKY